MKRYIGKRILWTIVCVLGVAAIITALTYFIADDDAAFRLLAKPVIYLYPEIETDVEVRLDLDGSFEFTYPEYDNGWHVTAYPDGKLINRADNNEYSYLFWEGTDDIDFDMSSGFVVAGADTVEFLREKLSYMGLNPKEYNEFIVYWAPRMQSNAYNLVTFQKEAYTEAARLEVVPTPDSCLRVFMTYKALNSPITIAEQELEQFERTGFAVIEWGGAELK